MPDETILGLLAKSPQHGYQLLSVFLSKEKLGRVWTLSHSQLYAVLKRLEQQGLISGRDVLASNTPPRRVYSLTAAGQRHLDEWMQDLPLSSSMRQIRVQFISRLYVAAQLGYPIEPLVSRQRQACLKQRDQLEEARSKTGASTEVLVLDFVIGQIDSALDWLDHCEETSQKAQPA